MTTFPSLSPVGERRQARLADARLAVVTDARRPPDELARFLSALCEASVDVLRLRDDTASEDTLRVAADVFRRVCDAAGALFLLDRLPGLSVQVAADGVHLGAVDVPPDQARRIVGPDGLIGRAVRTGAALTAAGDEDVDLLVLGEDVGDADRVELVRAAVDRASHPWFVAIPRPADAERHVTAGARRLVIQGGLDEEPAERCWTLRRLLAAHRM